MPETRRAICARTVEILGCAWPQTSTVWAGLLFHKAWRREIGLIGPDHHLAVPWAHIDDPPWRQGDAIYQVRCRDERDRFVRARNGVWVVERQPSA